MALDIALIVIWAVFIITAAKKGFALSLLEFAAFAAAMVISFQLSSAFAPGLYENWLEPKVILALQEALPAKGGTAMQQAQAVLASLPEEAVSFAQTVGIDVNYLAGQIKELNLGSSDQLARLLAERIGGPIVIQMCRLVLFCIFSVVISIILRLIAGVIDRIFSLPILNTALGAVLGAVKGLLVIALICMTARIVIDLNPQMSEGLKAIVDYSFIADTVNEFNPVLRAMRGISFIF